MTAMARLLGRYGAKTVALNRRVEEAIDWIKHAQLILSWPDNPNARRFVGVLSAAYAVPLIDIGSRVGPAGAGFVDVRTVLPGSGGCFFCLGGAGSNETTAVRTGSLLSVNSIAAGFAMLAFENLMAGLQTASQWIQVDLSRNGGFLAERRQLRGTPTRDCQVCREVGGADAAFTRLLQGHMPG
ncbi:MAG: ThiF family adenylyltransferase [Deltaproteobacteria bacterium]|nr:ThiF family adenylyltransferase [Deltaproteobacteria bacterium]